MGKKPVPTKLKVLKGTFRNNESLANEVDPDSCIPSAPDHLGKIALIEWGRASAEYYRLGLLTEMDRGTLATQCEAWELYVQACEIRSKLAEEDKEFHGLIEKTSNGNMIQHAIIGIINQSRKAYMDIVKEYGCTPAARTRVAGTPKKKPEEGFGAKFG